jgi:hypothetical protein
VPGAVGVAVVPGPRRDGPRRQPAAGPQGPEMYRLLGGPVGGREV